MRTCRSRRPARQRNRKEGQEGEEGKKDKKDKKDKKATKISQDAAGPEKLKRKTYETELARLHVELVKLQEWVKARGLKVCIVIGRA